MDGHNFLMRRRLLRHQGRLQSVTTSRTRQRTPETLYDYFSHVKQSALHKSTSQITATQQVLRAQTTSLHVTFILLHLVYLRRA
jgi:hypothetical protein